MAISDYINGPKFKIEITRLNSQIADLEAKKSLLHAEYLKLEALLRENEALTLLDIRNKISSTKQNLKQLEDLITEKKSIISELQNAISDKRSQILVLEETLLLESFALYLPKFKLTTSDEYKARLDVIREKQKDCIKNERAATGSQTWTVNNSQAEGRKLIKDMMKLILRAFNNECDYCVDNVKFNNIESHEKRIEKSFEALNKLGRVMQVLITSEYKRMKIEELQLSHEYQLKKQEEKEEQKKIREELREQQKLEQEIRAAREKIEKEKKHFQAALKEIENKLKKSDGSASEGDLTEKLNELRSKLAELEGEEKLVDYREQHAKAGYVYIISNIGSFGDNVFKIGMTRRLEPMDRIDELGDASVPFEFDVHALIFSENAPALEAKLHEHFGNSRINKMNSRKEFFRAEISDIENVIKANYDKVVDIVREAPAEQYRESLLQRTRV